MVKKHRTSKQQEVKNKINLNIANLIKTKRLNMGLSMKDIASNNLLTISTAQYSNYENAKIDMPLSTLYIICQILNIDILETVTKVLEVSKKIDDNKSTRSLEEIQDIKRLHNAFVEKHLYAEEKISDIETKQPSFWDKITNKFIK